MQYSLLIGFAFDSCIFAHELGYFCEYAPHSYVLSIQKTFTSMSVKFCVSLFFYC